MKFSELRNISRRKEAIVAMICLSPALFLAVVFIFIPIVNVFFLSFTNWDLLRSTKDFIGIKNYQYIFKDPKFIKSIINTFYFAGVKIPLDLILSLFIATILDKKVKFIRFFRASFFSPVIIPVVASTLVWVWMFDPLYGPFNQFLNVFGIPSQKWLYDPNLAMPSIILYSLWKGIGYDIIIFLAGLQAIPINYSEAARIDGANSRQIFFKITLPLLNPIVYFVVLMGIINSFKVFTQVSVMTPKGGPLYSTGVMVFYIYQQAFENYRIGRASAAAVVLFALILGITFFQRAFGKKNISYD